MTVTATKTIPNLSYLQDNQLSLTHISCMTSKINLYICMVTRFVDDSKENIQSFSFIKMHDHYIKNQI